MMIEALAAIVGPAHALGPDAIEARYCDDVTGGTAGQAIGLVRPGTVDEVAAILSWCHAQRQPVVTQGGRTGMTRAAVPRTGELILSLERLSAIETVDGGAGTMTVGAGCILQTAQETAAAAGWRLAVDIGARGSCTIGGMIATNAGGHQVLRHGMMRDQLLGIEAVLADGTIISSLHAMLKNNTGYDLKQLFIGSEGTLGIVTRAVLRLRPPPVGRQTALCAVAGYDAALRLLARLEHDLPGQLSAFELMWDDFFTAACRQTGQADPFGGVTGPVILVEAESRDANGLSAALEASFTDGILRDALVAQSDRDHQRFWRFREAIGELVADMPLVEPFDVSAPLGAIGRLVQGLRSELTAGAPGSQPIFFGHIGDGNLHIAIDLASENQRERAKAIVYDAVRDIGGSVSAEHGIGMLKRSWLGHSRSAAEIALMRTIRAALDPRGILNPDRIF